MVRHHTLGNYGEADLSPVRSWVLDRVGHQPTSWAGPSRTSMRRHCLSRADVAATVLVTECNGFECPSRYASIRTVSVSSLFGDSVHRMRSVLIRAKGAAIFRAVFLERWTKFAWRSRLMLDPKRVRARSAVADGHFRLA